MRVVLDTCFLKLATFPADNNASALIYELAHAGLIAAWVSPAILEEYADVLRDHPEFVAEIVESFPVCYPVTAASIGERGEAQRIPVRSGRGALGEEAPSRPIDRRSGD